VLAEFALMLAFAADALERPQIFAPGVISAPVTATAPTFFPDARSLVFEQDGGGKRRLMTAQMTKEGWSDPTEMILGGEWFYIEPALAADGSYLLVASNRDPKGAARALDGNWNGQIQPGRGGALWRVEKTASGWSTPHALSDRINAGNSSFEPALTRDGTLYFMRPGADGKFHILRAMAKDGDYDTPHEMPFTKTGISDVDPAVSPDERLIIFSSSRGSNKRLDLYVSFRVGNDWSEPKPLSPRINSGHSIIEPHFSPDAATLYYTQDHVIWTTSMDSVLSEVSKDSPSP